MAKARVSSEARASGRDQRIPGGEHVEIGRESARIAVARHSRRRLARGGEPLIERSAAGDSVCHLARRLGNGGIVLRHRQRMFGLRAAVVGAQRAAAEDGQADGGGPGEATTESPFARLARFSAWRPTKASRLTLG